MATRKRVLLTTPIRPAIDWARFRELRREKGWRQAEVAAALSVTAAAVSSWERGESVPAPHHHEAILSLLGGELAAREHGVIQ